MTDTPVALIVFLALGAVAVVLALLLVRAQQELGRAQLQADAKDTELERASRVASDLGARLKSVEAELRHLVNARIPELAASLSHPNVPVPGPLGTATLSPDLDRSLDSVLTQVRAEVTRERTRVDAAAQAAMRGATTAVQALLYQLQTLLQRMQEKYDDPLVAEDLLAADFLNEQALRRVQSTAVVCGAWPGLTRENSHIADVVVGASSRLSGYERIQVANLLRDPVGVVARAVEPVAVTLTELMANALHFSHPDLPVAVTLQQGDTGVSVIIDDAGVGMTPEEFTRAKRLMSGEDPVLITELGDPPRNGFAAVGRLVRQYGFSAHAEPSPYGGVRAVVHIPGEPLLTLLDEEEHPVSAMAPTEPYDRPLLPGRRGAGEHAAVPSAARSGETAPASTSPDPEAAEPGQLPRRRRRSRTTAYGETESAATASGSAASGGPSGTSSPSDTNTPDGASSSATPGTASGTAAGGSREARPSAEHSSRREASSGASSGSAPSTAPPSTPSPRSTPEESAARWAAFQQGTASGRAVAEPDAPSARPTDGRKSPATEEGTEPEKRAATEKGPATDTSSASGGADGAVGGSGASGRARKAPGPGDSGDDAEPGSGESEGSQSV